MPCAGPGAKSDECLVNAKYTAPRTQCAPGCAPPQRVHHVPLQGLPCRGGRARLHDTCLALTSPPHAQQQCCSRGSHLWYYHVHAAHCRGSDVCRPICRQHRHVAVDALPRGRARVLRQPLPDGLRKNDRFGCSPTALLDLTEGSMTWTSGKLLTVLLQASCTSIEGHTQMAMQLGCKGVLIVMSLGCCAGWKPMC